MFLSKVFIFIMEFCEISDYEWKLIRSFTFS